MFMNMVNSSEQSRLDGPNDSMTMIAAPTTSSTATNSSSTNNNPNTLVYNHNNKSIEQKKKELTLNLGGSGGMQLGLNGFTPARTLNTPQMLNNMNDPGSTQVTDLTSLPSISTPHMNKLISDFISKQDSISAPLTTPNLIITPGGSLQSANPFSLPSFPTYVIQGGGGGTDPNGSGGGVNNSNQYLTGTPYSNLPTGLTPTISVDPRNIFHQIDKSQQGGQTNDINNNNNNFPTLITYSNLQPVKSNQPGNETMITTIGMTNGGTLTNGPTLIRLNPTSTLTNIKTDDQQTVPVQVQVPTTMVKSQPVTKKSKQNEHNQNTTTTTSGKSAKNKQQQQQQQQINNNQMTSFTPATIMNSRRPTETSSMADTTDSEAGDDGEPNSTNQKLENKRKRNREAARKCRERKLQKIADLEKQVQALRDSNTAQETRIRTLKDEIQQLHVKFENHQRTHHCDLKL